MHRRQVDDEGNKISSPSNNSAVLEVDVAHLGEYDGSLLGYLRAQPAIILPALEKAASDALDTLLYDLRKENFAQDDEEESGETSGTKKSEARIAVQVLLKGNLAMTPLRSIKSEHINHLIRCPGTNQMGEKPSLFCASAFAHCSLSAL